MTPIVLPRKVASARSGDKGDISYISAWVYDPHDYEDVKARLTVQRLKSLHPKLWRGPIERYELPDFHGKSFSYLLLGMTVEVGR